jgi:hypothetical protein
MTMSLKRYIVKPATANMLEKMLNDMWEEGYEPIENTLPPVGAKESQNPLMPGQTTVMPLHSVVFKRRMEVDA